MKTFGGKQSKGFSLPNITINPSKIDTKEDNKSKVKIRVRTHK